MKQYIVYYNDGSTEIVEAYNCTFKHSRAVFDKGHGSVKVCVDVKWIEFA